MNAREYLDNFARRVVQDAVCSAMPEHYERRARQLEAVGTPRCREVARACRNAAEFWRRYGPELLAPEVDEVFTAMDTDTESAA